MARIDPEPARRAARLYLMTPPLDGATDAWAEALDAVRAAGDVAAVLVRLSLDGAPGRDERLAAFVGACQVLGVACLVAGDAVAAIAAAADGAHLDGVAALRSALPALRPDRIAGVGGLRTKHDAMTAAEAGADYVMIGEPDGDDRRPPFAATLERVEWWSQLFETPCVGYAGSLEEVAQLSAAGADFVAIGTPLALEAGADRVAAQLAAGVAG
ncbi:thiamine phosphate synthase [Ancylobacter terrae]|uniref:thiamine phosphate synthase n=1 Tax=Ancylobacter sp. sgz301288 TaxID=3342077 RepID=UPI00385EC79D